MTTTTVHTTITGPVQISATEQGEGQPFLILHGGAGPQSVGQFAALLAATGRARVITPTHPGFGGTPRPDALASIPALAACYAQLLEDLGLTDVVVIGNSIGGWIAAELALRGSSRVRGVVLVDAAGLLLPEFPVADFFSLTLDQVAELSYYRPDAFRIDLEAIPDAQKAVMAGNRAALAVYGGTAMGDPALLSRLPAVSIPTLVVWGAADHIIPPEHGKAIAGAIPGADFELISDAGHLPQLETPELLVRLVTDFAATAGQQDAG
jgi:pimeloyl-ACP methyl ester carboxylesterase